MKAPSWFTKKDEDEFEAACKDAWESSEISGERYAKFVEFIEDSIQAHREWGIWTQRMIMHAGAANVLKSWKKSQETVVYLASSGPKTKSQVWGVKRLSGEGVEYETQVLFTMLTVDELQVKKFEQLRLSKTYSESAQMFSALIDFCLAFGARTAEEAAIKSGISVQDWLEGKAA